MKKYIKIIGANGSGKTATVRMLGSLLAGRPCDSWRANENHPIRHHHCSCGRYAAMGKWAEHLKCCGMDAISARKNFNYAENIQKFIETIKGDVIFEEGLTTSSMRIHYAINEVANLYNFTLDYPAEVCRERIEKLRGGRIKDKNLYGKIKGIASCFEKLEGVKKFKLSGTLEENAWEIIDKAGIASCGCMFSIPKQKELF